MTKSYNLKIFANKTKLQKLDNLLSFWGKEVQRKIDIFWKFSEIKGSYCPSECALGGRIVRDASTKAWQIVKGAKATKQKEKPVFKGNEIDLNECSIRFISEFKTKEFDFWVKVTHLEKYNRLILPCKKIGIFNKAIEIGNLRKSAKIIKIRNEYYLQVFVRILEVEKENGNKIGIDVGLNNPIVTSNEDFLGEDLKDLRIKTKYRKYVKKISPYKQGLNRCAKELVELYPNTDFVVEDLQFKGKKGRTKTFRRRNNNWAYNHLSKKLEEIGKLKGFQLIKVNPAYSSQTCPICGFIDKRNRQGSLFLCGRCGYERHADVVGAINLVERVLREHSVSDTPYERG